ncbi:MAG: TetR/AcrR family transcriptional regulator [Actinomycetota bacterium]|nr:TetR/AcrR family transcriptional regulator [Actinomycetota bacterium]
MTAEPVRLDRRHRRRLETIEEIVDVAIEVMTEYGVGGLSLGEVARRIGMRTPSLYVYFDSKHAVYDAVFARGWRAVHETMTPAYAGVHDAADLPAYFLYCARLFVGWMLEHPVQAQLMGWRPVPGYEPSAEAYEPAIAVLAAAQVSFEQLRERGLFRADADVELLLRTWTVLTSGVMTQQLANAPDATFDEGAFTATLPDLVSMFLTQYGPPARPRLKGKS